MVPAARATRGRPPAALAARSAEPEPRSDLRVSWNMGSPPTARRLRCRVCENADAGRVGYGEAESGARGYRLGCRRPRPMDLDGSAIAGHDLDDLGRAQ